MGKIVVDGVSYSYGELKVLENCGFEVKDGEIVAIVGPSGCGKSTLLLLIDGLIKPTSGNISITKKNPEVLEKAVVFQEFNRALLPWRNVHDNVILGLELLNLRGEKYESLVTQYIQMIGLSDFAKAMPHQLSGGMKQRVQIARVLACNPDIILMDEPLGALDAQTKEAMLDELERLLERERRTIVYVTHDVQEAVYIADEILVLSRRPSKVVERVRVDMSRPRPSLRQMRKNQSFIDYSDRVWEVLSAQVST